MWGDRLAEVSHAGDFDGGDRVRVNELGTIPNPLRDAFHSLLSYQRVETFLLILVLGT